jgi:undecaprenyl-phosphate galactose phosphotransferase
MGTMDAAFKPQTLERASPLDLDLAPLLNSAVEATVKSTVRSALKRTADILGALVLLVLLAPALVVLGAAVSASRGPILYSQKRIGRDGRAFKCYKFRSMVPDADAVLRELLAKDPQARADWERDFKLKNDPRVTRIGAFLRKTSLDELPQLFNVLKGDMSLVGPRPVVRDEIGRYGKAASLYLSVRPGMTGLWQVSGRNDIRYRRRVAMDAYYVRSWTLWLDIAILLMTVRVVLMRRGAY